MSKESNLNGYKRLLQQIIDLQGQSGVLLYDRMTLLIEVFNDREFRADHGNVDDIKAAETLSRYIADTALTFLELKAMREHYTNRHDWADGRLRRMYDKMVRERKEKRAAEKAERGKLVSFVTTGERIRKRKDAKNGHSSGGVATGVADDPSRVAQLEAENKELRARCKKLLEANMELQEQVAQLTEKNEDLEAMLYRREKELSRVRSALARERRVDDLLPASV